ncbi:MAG TPA: bifunctional UDP-N-acetylglucosamine diphosphorylase/glucosamine-1-phosphate N-acetyltransferase GlmU [Bryobacteraceae bacterium]|nr:bifunctional UDP-N-acetylglucosamine diphosphorylase/glucosamine-1-phosphate N-acetyltransferase GlmU [Bryobacteraceae bacterium]
METHVTVVILAAGLGTRMKSRKAKVLHRAGGKMLIEHAVATACRLAAPERVFVVVGHQADRIREAVQTPGVGFIEQTEQRGTGHAVLIGRRVLEPLGGYLVVTYADGPLLRAETIRRLVTRVEESGAAGALLTAMLDDPTGYGRIVRGHDGRIRAIVEQKAATPEQLRIREANMGIYCYRADLFWKHAAEIRDDNPAREYYLTDMVEILGRSGHPVEAVLVEDAREALGINNRIELAEADRILRQRKVSELMLAGVTIEKPETVTIDPDVSIGMDTVIGPFAQILGRTSIGEDCRVGACSIVKDSELADDVEVGPFTFVGSSRLGRGANVGPFARLRFGNQVDESAHIGNFVELKNAHLGPGAKANHLAYLGDAEIGAKSNIGAGTITCNYDGMAKHKTTIGEQVFVGSNSTLVAPLEIGSGAYLGAGSVITDAVPADALALGRARQILKPGWAAGRRKRVRSEAK